MLVAAGLRNKKKVEQNYPAGTQISWLSSQNRVLNNRRTMNFTSVRVSTVA